VESEEDDEDSDMLSLSIEGAGGGVGEVCEVLLAEDSPEFEWVEPDERELADLTSIWRVTFSCRGCAVGVC